MPKPKEVPPDEIELLDDGRINLRVDGAEFVLRNPKLGEMKRFDQALNDIARRQGEANDKKMQDPEGFEMPDFVGEVADWVRDVVATLNTTDAELPAENDEFPTWLVQSKLQGELRMAWREVPWGPGGAPTQRMFKMAEDLPPEVLKILGPALTAQLGRAPSGG